MTTSFSSLPIIDIGALKSSQPIPDETEALSKQLYNVFATTGFAYLVNVPLSFDHEEIFDLSQEFFALPMKEKMRLAKKTFRPTNRNTYRGYFPTQPQIAKDNLKEGFEIGNPGLQLPSTGEHVAWKQEKVVLSEPNVWPSQDMFAKRQKLEEMYYELQMLASQLLSLLAISLGKDATFFDPWLVDSLSTLRLLHYPPAPQNTSAPLHPDAVKLSCTPHTDSGILTLLHQDSTGGLEVLNASGSWVPAPYVPGSIVVNIGDLMAKVSGGRFMATMHRVRAPGCTHESGSGRGRYSVPFFFEPGERCVVGMIDGEEEGVVYGEHVKWKMSTWVEYQEDSGYDTGNTGEL